MTLAFSPLEALRALLQKLAALGNAKAASKKLLKTITESCPRLLRSTLSAQGPSHESSSIKTKYLSSQRAGEDIMEVKYTVSLLHSLTFVLLSLPLSH